MSFIPQSIWLLCPFTHPKLEKVPKKRRKFLTREILWTPRTNGRERRKVGWPNRTHTPLQTFNGWGHCQSFFWSWVTPLSSLLSFLFLPGSNRLIIAKIDCFSYRSSVASAENGQEMGQSDWQNYADLQDCASRVQILWFAHLITILIELHKICRTWT